jgi:hypothetical protein
MIRHLQSLYLGSTRHTKHHARPPSRKCNSSLDLIGQGRPSSPTAYIQQDRFA